MLLREHFVLRCQSAGLCRADVRPTRAVFSCETGLANFSMDHPSTVSRPKPAAAADAKELSAEEQRRHRAIRAAVSPHHLHGRWSVDEFVRTARARALYEQATNRRWHQRGVAAEPDSLFLKASRTFALCQSDARTRAEAKELIAVAPGCAEAWALYAMSLDEREALTAVDHALALDPSQSTAWWTRAGLCRRALNFEEAVRAIQQARRCAEGPAPQAEWLSLEKELRSYCVDASEPGSAASLAMAARNYAGSLSFDDFAHDSVVKLRGDVKRLEIEAPAHHHPSEQPFPYRCLSCGRRRVCCCRTGSPHRRRRRLCDGVGLRACGGVDQRRRQCCGPGAGRALSVDCQCQ
jgi:hypothetical protein